MDDEEDLGEITPLLGVEDSDRTPTISIQNSPSFCKQLLAALITCLGSISTGMALGYSSPTVASLQQEGILTDYDQVTWFGSLITVGAIAGGPLAGVIAEKMGRKTAVMFCSLFLSIGWFVISLSHGYILIYCGRILTGIGCGMASQSIPLYISEIATKNLRGTFVALFQVSVTIGILLVYGLGILLPWRWLSNVCNIFSVLMILGMLLLPESPSWLVGQESRLRAMESLLWFRGRDHDIEEEYYEIRNNLSNHQDTSVTLRDFFTPGIYRPIIIGIGMMMFQQGTGINAVIFYSQSIFKNAGFKDNPHLPPVIVGAVQVIATLISCFLMDRTGRRILLSVSGLLMTISLAVFGSYFYMTQINHIENISWLSLTCVLVFITAFSLGWGPIPWIVAGEIFPVKIRGMASGLAISLNWGAAFVITKEFHDMQESPLNKYGTFWLFGGFTFCGILFVLLLLPETKGKSLEEIEDYFEERDN